MDYFSSSDVLFVVLVFTTLITIISFAFIIAGMIKKNKIIIIFSLVAFVIFIMISVIIFILYKNNKAENRTYSTILWHGYVEQGDYSPISNRFTNVFQTKNITENIDIGRAIILKKDPEYTVGLYLTFKRKYIGKLKLIAYNFNNKVDCSNLEVNQEEGDEKIFVFKFDYLKLKDFEGMTLVGTKYLPVDSTE